MFQLLCRNDIRKEEEGERGGGEGEGKRKGKNYRTSMSLP